jgi:hypothetical protein
VHVGRNLGQRVVVKTNIGIEEVFDSANVVLVGLPSFAELLGAEIYV